jgi:4-alpha-glucanotransferase
MFYAENDCGNVSGLFFKTISYQYQLVDERGNTSEKEFVQHHLNFPHNYKEFIIFDEWNNKTFLKTI